MSIVGRFAPSPTGNLHIGSLITAVASFCIAKRQNGSWLVRMEDVDEERCKTAFSDQILTDLTRLGLHWDGEIYYQSQNLERYHTILDNQLQHVSYGCDCSRKSIQTFLQKNNLVENSIYPKICEHKQLSRHNAIRLVMPDKRVEFLDKLQGNIVGNPQQEHGDIVVRRKAMPNSTQNPKGMINYMLAVVVDDIAQGVNQIVRGLDILPLTTAQLVIYDYLIIPRVQDYYHLPILVNDKGQKLSKQTLAEPICDYKPQDLLALALRFLGQAPVDKDKPEVMLQQAICQWDSTPLIGQKQMFCPRLNSFF
ncbi:tRNA glutamyl-Q(34) synthetase GluQRS [Faucicola mancuniensis]|uniref:tRNA glutamyl-Q(34) synthetase GluQRS n=1 Tax=Faucicola mancuniensis TaxID=1309795 RepID=UPI0028E81247|nr:tRNA glutamyl-Q(34) synthetase GluQRS [uncultured Moraxella sp.]